ncbi:MAG: hypothetical protein GXO69_00145 [Acidobacteria bacterium]|nr:hypothetical protein [Acidobacteriota bacterium]
MKFLKKLFSGKKTGGGETGSKEISAIFSPLPASAEDFMGRIRRLQSLHLPSAEYNQHVRYFVTSLPEWLTREIHRMIRHEIYRVNIAPPMDAEITKSFISMRIAIYNRDYKRSHNPLLSRVFMVLFHLAPELLKNQHHLESAEAELTSSLNLEEIVADLSIFNLSEEQMQYTVSRILEYNEKNVVYTEEELILMNNSEILRELLERLTQVFQSFVQSISNWQRYRNPVEIGLHPLALPVLDIDTKEFFPGQNPAQPFLDTIFGDKSAKELENMVPKKLRPLFTKDFKLVIAAIRNTILREHHQLITDTRKLICWYLILMDTAEELPPQPIIRSLLEKSLQFHRNYYPELIHGVLPVIDRILAVIGKDNSGLRKLSGLYPEEITCAMKEYVSGHFSRTISYEEFIDRNIKKQKLAERSAPVPFFNGQYQPEELEFIKRNPDAELGILMMNEKLSKAENEEPLLEEHYFFPNRESYLKLVLLETLQSLLTVNAPLKIIRSLLEKSMDRTKVKSAAIMQKLLSRLKEDGLKRNVIERILDKQMKEHHISTIIKQELARDPKWEWILAAENPHIHLDTFSRVTGIAFLRAETGGKRYKITAKYENGRWSVTRIAPESCSGKNKS